MVSIVNPFVSTPSNLALIARYAAALARTVTAKSVVVAADVASAPHVSRAQRMIPD
jgi:hypothetical protein